MCVNGERIHPPVQLIIHFNNKNLDWAASVLAIIFLSDQQGRGEREDSTSPFLPGRELLGSKS